jgi:hypothetical protein
VGAAIAILDEQHDAGSRWKNRPGPARRCRSASAPRCGEELASRLRTSIGLVWHTLPSRTALEEGFISLARRMELRDRASGGDRTLTRQHAELLP